MRTLIIIIVCLMILATLGFIGWFVHLLYPEWKWFAIFIGPGFGLSYGRAIPAWYADIKYLIKEVK